MKMYFSRKRACLVAFATWVLSITISQAQDQEATGGTRTEANRTIANEVPEDIKSIARGRSLFSEHCTVCHQVGKQIIGPALASVHNRRPVDWLVKFIQNSQQVIIDEEDEYAQYLYGQYEQQVMPNFEFLSREDILDILAYIRAESIGSTTSGVSSGTEVTVEAAQQSVPSQDGPTDVAGGEGSSRTLVTILSVAVLVLLAAVIFLAVRGRSNTTA